MPVFETNALSKHYPSVRALDELNVSIEPGIVGLVGANGAGKSTLIKLLLGLIQPTSGGAQVLGYDIRTQGLELRQYVGYMPEHDCLPPEMNATEFVAHMAQVSGLPAAASRERASEALRYAGLFEARYRQIAGYSTGMKQRAKLAQALVHDPRIVFLDEPTNGLDPAGRDDMLDLIRRTGHQMGITIVMATHLLGEIERTCDQLIVIDAGRLLHQGSVAEFTAATETLEVEVTGDPAPLAARLAAAGIEVTTEGQSVFLRPDGVAPYDLVRDSVVDLGLGLVRIQQRRHTLEDLFRVEASEVEV
ncbi:MAG: ABC transporter ATP-binding protein [Dehalococcoidia bacterium]|nr:ABC transporter ATP-binding protein [Dehalococcoidia bacterium]